MKSEFQSRSPSPRCFDRVDQIDDADNNVNQVNDVKNPHTGLVPLHAGNSAQPQNSSLLRFAAD